MKILMILVTSGTTTSCYLNELIVFKTSIFNSMHVSSKPMSQRPAR